MPHLWVVNRGTEQITIDAGELFGFNTGSYVEIPAGYVVLKLCSKDMFVGHCKNFEPSEYLMMGKL